MYIYIYIYIYYRSRFCNILYSYLASVETEHFTLCAMRHFYPVLLCSLLDYLTC